MIPIRTSMVGTIPLSTNLLQYQGSLCDPTVCVCVYVNGNDINANSDRTYDMQHMFAGR